MPKENANEQVQDVFISYGHADDEVPYGAKFGWVTTFVEELKKRLRSKLGGSGARIWMDYQLAANDQVTETLLDTVTPESYARALHVARVRQVAMVPEGIG